MQAVAPPAPKSKSGKGKAAAAAAPAPEPEIGFGASEESSNAVSRAAFKAVYDNEVRIFIQCLGPKVFKNGTVTTMRGMHGMDPLEFCRTIEKELPTLTTLFASIYAAPGSSAGPESVFSHAGRIVGKLRTRLTGPRTERVVRAFIRNLKASKKRAESVTPAIPVWPGYEAAAAAFLDAGAVDEDPNVSEEGLRGIDDISDEEYEDDEEVALYDEDEGMDEE